MAETVERDARVEITPNAALQSGPAAKGKIMTAKSQEE
jgi:hypothetical protein